MTRTAYPVLLFGAVVAACVFIAMHLALGAYFSGLLAGYALAKLETIS